MQIEPGGNVHIHSNPVHNPHPHHTPPTHHETHSILIGGVSTHTCIPLLHKESTYTGTSICIPLPGMPKEDMDSGKCHVCMATEFGVWCIVCDVIRKMD
ncbi:hypothetical protein EON63_07135 [archaeon]|nr:MAG: hypothetical protein EON63_07135 [archaeon]